MLSPSPSPTPHTNSSTCGLPSTAPSPHAFSFSFLPAPASSHAPRIKKPNGGNARYNRYRRRSTRHPRAHTRTRGLLLAQVGVCLSRGRQQRKVCGVAAAVAQDGDVAATVELPDATSTPDVAHACLQRNATHPAQRRARQPAACQVVGNQIRTRQE